MALLEIVQAGAPVLRRPTRPLAPAELASARVQELIESMRDTMRAAPGVGLAAPQIGESLQLVVIEDSPDRQAALTPEQLAARGRAVVPFHVLVNPTLTVIGDEVADAFEGCLSIAGLVMGVPRAYRVRVEALDERGQRVVREASGWYARILQHEVDHLRGVLCCDRMDPRTLSTAANLAAHWSGATPDEVRAALAAP
ncbi:MAG TPA: peptide deformylase [Kofleriaceae bacterium]|jgi:peptide deformylase|nr:peptide deformylase [Kofleriaceae bacterium]